MFKPEYILDNVAAFGYEATIELVEAKFKRMGKNARMSFKMACNLVDYTLQWKY